MSFIPTRDMNKNHEEDSPNLASFQQPTPITENKTVAWPFANFFSPTTDMSTVTRDVLEEEAKKNWVVDRNMARYLSQDLSISREFGDTSQSREGALLDRYFQDAKQAAGPHGPDESAQAGAATHWFPGALESTRSCSELGADGTAPDRHPASPAAPAHVLLGNQSSNPNAASGLRANMAGTDMFQSSKVPGFWDERAWNAVGYASPGQPMLADSPLVQQKLTTASMAGKRSEQDLTTTQLWRASLFTNATTPDGKEGAHYSYDNPLVASYEGSAAELGGNSQFIPSTLFQELNAGVHQHGQQDHNMSNNSMNNAQYAVNARTDSIVSPHQKSMSDEFGPGSPDNTLAMSPQFPQGLPHALLDNLDGFPHVNANTETATPHSTHAQQHHLRQLQNQSSIWQHPLNPLVQSSSLSEKHQQLASLLQAPVPSTSVTPTNSRPQTPGKHSHLGSPVGSVAGGSISLQQVLQHNSLEPFCAQSHVTSGSMSPEHSLQRYSQQPSRAQSPETPAQPLHRSPTARGSGASSDCGSVCRDAEAIPVRVASNFEAGPHVTTSPLFHALTLPLPSPPSVNQVHHQALRTNNMLCQVPRPTSPQTARVVHTPEHGIVRQNFINDVERNGSTITWEFGNLRQQLHPSPPTVEMITNANAWRLDHEQQMPADTPKDCATASMSSTNDASQKQEPNGQHQTGLQPGEDHTPMEITPQTAGRPVVTQVKWYTPPEWALPLLSDTHEAATDIEESDVSQETDMASQQLDLHGALENIKQLAKENSVQKKQIQAMQKSMATYQQQLSTAVKALEESEATKKTLQKLLADQIKEAQYTQMQLQQLQMQVDERNSTIEQLTIANSSPRMSSICSKDDFGEYDQPFSSLYRSSSQSFLNDWNRPNPQPDISAESAPPPPPPPPQPQSQSQISAPLAQTEESRASYLSSSHDTIQASPLAEALKRVRSGAINSAPSPFLPQADKPGQTNTNVAPTYKPGLENSSNDPKWLQATSSNDPKWLQDDAKVNIGTPEPPASASSVAAARPPPGPGLNSAQPNKQHGAATKQHTDMYLEFIELRCSLEQLGGLSDEVAIAVCALLQMQQDSLAIVKSNSSSESSGAVLGFGNNMDGNKGGGGKEPEGSMDDNLAAVKKCCQAVTSQLRGCLSLLQSKHQNGTVLIRSADNQVLRSSSTSVSVQVPPARPSILEDLQDQHRFSKDSSFSDPVEKLHWKIDELEKELEESRSLSAQQSELTCKLIESKQELQANLDSRVRRISELEMCISKQQRDLAQREKAGDDLRSFCADLTHKLEWRDSNIQQLKDTQAALEEQLQHKDKLEQQLQDSVDELKVQLQGQQTTAKHLQDALASTQNGLAKKDEQLDELQQELGQLQSHLETQSSTTKLLEVEKSKLETSIAEKEALLQELQTGQANLNDELTELAKHAETSMNLHDTIAGLQEKLAAKEEELQQMNMQTKQTSRKLAEAEAKYAAMSSELNASKEAAQQLAARVNQLEDACSKMTELQTEMADMAVELTNTKMRCSELQAQLSQVLAELSECLTQRDIAQENAEQRQKELSSTAALCQKLQSKVMGDDSKLQEQQQKSEMLKSALRKREDELADVTRQLKECAARVDLKGREVERLMKALHDLQAAAGSATDMAARSEDRLTELQQLLSEAENDVLRQKSRNMNLLVQVEGLESQLKARDDEAQSRKQHLSELEESLVATEEELDAVKTRCQELEQQLSSQQQQLATWKHTHKSTSQELQSKERMLHQQEEELTGLRNEAAKCKELVGCLQTAHSKVESLEKQLRQVQEANAELQERMSTQRSVIDQLEASLGITEGQEDIIAELRHNVLTHDMVNKRLRHELEQQHERQQAMKAQQEEELHSLQTRCVELQEQLASREMAASQQESDLCAARAGLEELEHQLDNRDLAIDELQKDLFECQGTCEELKQQLRSKEAAVSALEVELHVSKDRAVNTARLEQSLEDRNRAYSQVEAELGAAHHVLQELKQQLDSRNGIIAHLEAELQQAQSQQPITEELKTQVHSKDQRIEELQQQVNLLVEQQAVVAELEKQLESQRQVTKQFEAELQNASTHQQVAVELQQHLEQRTAHVAQLQAEAGLLQVRVTELGQKLDASNLLVSRMEAGAQTQATFLEELKGALSKSEEIITHLENKANSLQAELASKSQKPEQSEGSVQCEELTAQMMETMQNQVAEQQAELGQLKRELIDAADMNTKLHGFVEHLQHENEDLHKQLDASEMAVSELHSLMGSLQKQMAMIEAAAQLKANTQSAGSDKSHDTSPQQDQDVSHDKSKKSHIRHGGTAFGLPVEDLSNRFDSVATQTSANVDEKNRGADLPPSAAPPDVQPMIPDKTADWILSLISGLETEQEVAGMQKLKGRIEELERTLLAVQQQQQPADAGSMQSTYTNVNQSSLMSRRYGDVGGAGALDVSASNSSMQSSQSEGVKGEKEKSFDSIMQNLAAELWGAKHANGDGTGSNEVWIQRAQKMYQAVVLLQEECKKHQQAARQLTAALEQERQSCKVLKQQNNAMQDDMKHQQKLQEVTQTVIGQLEENIRQVDSLKEVQDENASLRRGLHVITDYVRKLRTRTTTTVACSPIVRPGSGSSTPQHASNAPSASASPRTSSQFPGKAQVLCTDSACQCELLPSQSPVDAAAGLGGQEVEAAEQRRASNGVAASGAGAHSPSHTDVVSSSEQDAGLWEQLRSAVTRSAVSCKIELDQGNGGRQWLLASAIQMLRAQKNEIKRMVWTVKQLGPNGALVQGTSQLRQQYDALLAKHSALQSAHQQLEATVQKLTEENTTLVNVIRDQQQMLITAKSTSATAGRLSPQVKPSLSNPLRSNQLNAPSTQSPSISHSLTLAMAQQHALSAKQAQQHAHTDSQPQHSTQHITQLNAQHSMQHNQQYNPELSAQHNAQLNAQNTTQHYAQHSSLHDAQHSTQQSALLENHFSGSSSRQEVPHVFQPYALPNESSTSVNSGPSAQQRPHSTNHPWDPRSRPANTAAPSTSMGLTSSLMSFPHTSMPQTRDTPYLPSSILDQTVSSTNQTSLDLRALSAVTTSVATSSAQGLTAGDWLVPSAHHPSMHNIRSDGWEGGTSTTDNRSMVSTPDSASGALFSGPGVTSRWEEPPHHTTRTVYHIPSHKQDRMHSGQLQHHAPSGPISGSANKDQDIVQALINCYGSGRNSHGHDQDTIGGGAATISDNLLASLSEARSGMGGGDVATESDSTSVAGGVGRGTRTGSRIRERVGGSSTKSVTSSHRVESQRVQQKGPAKRDGTGKVFKV